MDRNTVIGLLLIGVVIFGFSWFNKPQEQLQTAQTEQHLQSQSTAPLSSAPNTPTPSVADSLGRTDSVALPLYQQSRAEQIVTLKNQNLSIKLSTHGGAPTEAVLAKYLNQEKKPVTLFSGKDTRLNLPLRTLDNKLVNTADAHFELYQQTDSTAVMRLPLDSASYLDFTYTLAKDDYRLQFSVSGQNLDRILPVNTTLQDLEWSLKIPQQEQSWKFEAQYTSIYYYGRGGSVDDLSTNKEEQEKISESLRWVAFKDKYFSSVLINNNGSFDSSTIGLKAMQENSGYIRDCSLRTSFPFGTKAGIKGDFTFFFGPNDYDLLRSYDEHIDDDAQQLKLDHLVYLGWSGFRFINKYLIIPIVSFLQGFIGNWGIIILILTLIIKMLLWPFTYKGYISQAKMRVLKPQVEAINQKYPGQDQETMMKRQKETMALYSAAGASPMSGCLPMLLQMPFLIALYMYFPTSILLRGQSFLWANDLSTYDAVLSWNFDIPLVSSLLGNHLSLFCLLMTITNIVYNRYMMVQSGSGQEGMAGMKWMPYIMSIMFFFMFNQNASGLSYYYFISTLITIIQYLAFRYTLNEEKLLAQLEENKKKPKKKSGFMARLEEAQRQQMEAQRKQKKNR